MVQKPIDPRQMEICERERQRVQKLIERREAQKVAEDKRNQEIAVRNKRVAGKRKERQKPVEQDWIGKRQGLRSEHVEDDSDKWVIPRRFPETEKSHKPPSERTEDSRGTPPPAAPQASNKGLPSLFDCAERLKERIPLIHYQDSLYAYNGFCYDILFPDDVIRLYRERVDDKLGGEKSLSNINQLHKYLCTDGSIRVEEFKSNQRIAVLENGIFDVMTGKLRKHTHKEVTFSYIKAKYLDNGKCKHFRKFLRDITHEDDILQERLWQFLGYMLMQTNEAKAFFVMGEAPDSGKSLLGNFIESLFDERYVSNIALNDFNRNFALAPIAGSAINVSLDLPATQLKPSAVSQLKMLTGGDAFNINQKYVPEFRYRNRAKLLFATNFPIELLDHDDAFWRRMVYLPFDYSVPEAKRNPNLLEVLQEEKDAIVSEALRHAKTLVENGFRFPTTPQIGRKIQEWQGKQCATIEQFLHDCCELGENFKGELMATLYPAYEAYCEESGFVPKHQTEFKRFLEQEVGLTHTKLRLGCENPQSAFRGIKLMEVRYD
ncbi:phage/plasmid primase, P4 family [Oscillospiraceae bacterium 50-16]